MMRAIFWICVAVGLAAFFWFAANSKHMTAGQNLLVWTLIFDLVMIAFTAYGVGMLIYGLKKRCGHNGLRSYRKARAFSRDEQPIGYWLCIAIYIFGFARVYMLFMRVTENWFRCYDVALTIRRSW